MLPIRHYLSPTCNSPSMATKLRRTSRRPNRSRPFVKRMKEAKSFCDRIESLAPPVRPSTVRPSWISDSVTYRACHTSRLGQPAKTTFSPFLEEVDRWVRSVWHQKYHPFLIRRCRRTMRTHQLSKNIKNQSACIAFRRLTVRRSRKWTSQCHDISARRTLLRRALIVYDQCRWAAVMEL